MTTACTGVFCSDRDRLVSELADSEYRLARELAATRELLHIALEQLHEKERQLARVREKHRRLRDECRGLREMILRDGQRAA